MKVWILAHHRLHSLVRNNLQTILIHIMFAVVTARGLSPNVLGITRKVVNKDILFLKDFYS